MRSWDPTDTRLWKPTPQKPGKGLNDDDNEGLEEILGTNSKNIVIYMNQL